MKIEGQQDACGMFSSVGTDIVRAGTRCDRCGQPARDHLNQLAGPGNAAEGHWCIEAAEDCGACL